MAVLDGIHKGVDYPDSLEEQEESVIRYVSVPTTDVFGPFLGMPVDVPLESRDGAAE